MSLRTGRRDARGELRCIRLGAESKLILRKPLIDFRASEHSTIGMELEFQLLDASTLDLMNGILPLMDLYPGSPYVKPEFVQNTVEVASKVCTSVPELEEHLRGIVADLQEECRTLGMALCGAGTHPFGQRLALITPKPRYLQIEAGGGEVVRAHLRIGKPEAEVIEVGEEIGSDLIVVGRRVLSTLRRPVGSVSRNIAAYAHCSVLVVRGE